MSHPEQQGNLEIECESSFFTIVSNHVLRNKSLSLKAKGLFAWLCSHAGTQNMCMDWIVNSCDDGKAAIQTAIKELKANGYLIITPKMVDGKFSGYVWKVGGALSGNTENRASHKSGVLLKKTTPKKITPKKTTPEEKNLSHAVASPKDSGLDMLPGVVAEPTPYGRDPVEEKIREADPVLQFAIEAKDGVWRCPVKLLNALRETYPDANFLMEFRKARNWILANPSKTPQMRGMTKFINAWMNKHWEFTKQERRAIIANEVDPEMEALLDKLADTCHLQGGFLE